MLAVKSYNRDGRNNPMEKNRMHEWNVLLHVLRKQCLMNLGYLRMHERNSRIFLLPFSAMVQLAVK